MSALDTAWMAGARCEGMETNIFFPPAVDRRRMYVLGERARRICGECVVRGECLEYAIEHNELGIWGGTSREERAGIAERRKGAA